LRGYASGRRHTQRGARSYGQALEMLSFVGLLDKAHQIADKLIKSPEETLHRRGFTVRPKLLLSMNPRAVSIWRRSAGSLIW